MSKLLRIREVFSRRFASYKLKDKIVMSPHRGTSLSANSRRWVIFLRLGYDRDRVVGNGPDPFALVRPHPRTAETSGIFTTLDEFYFTTSEKKILENCRCIVPNFMND